VTVVRIVELLDYDTGDPFVATPWYC